jgi:PAS domain S-box-containing protein
MTDLVLLETTHLFTIEQWMRLHSSIDVLMGLVYYWVAGLILLHLYNRWDKPIGKQSNSMQPGVNLIPFYKLPLSMPTWLVILVWFLGKGTLHFLQAGTILNPAHWLFSFIVLTLGISLYGFMQLRHWQTQPLLMAAAGATPPFLTPSVSSGTGTRRVVSQQQNTASGPLKTLSPPDDLSRIIRFSVDQMTDPMLWIGASGELLYGNQSACHFFGYQATELQSLTIHDITADFSASMWSFHWHILQRCGSLKIETRCRTKHQRLLPVEMTINHLHVPNAPECQCIVIRDISDHKQIERALRQRQGELRSLVTNIPGAIYRCAFDTARTMAFISDGIEPIIQYPAADLIYNRLCRFISLIHPVDQSVVTRQIQTAIEQQQPYTLEYRLQCKDGSWRWVYDQGQGVFDAKGKLLWLNGALFDITDNKHALEALKASEERLQLALSGTHQGLWDWHIQDHEIYLSPQWPVLLGYPIGEIDGRPQSWLKLVHPQDRHRLLQGIRQHLLGHTALCHVEHRMRSYSGEWRWVLNRSKVVSRDHQGQALRMIGTVQDISDRKLAEARERAKTQQLEQTLQQLKQTQTQLIQSEKLSSLGQMVAGLAHEINNPVTFISGNISFAHQYLEDLLQLITLYQQHCPQPCREVQDWMDEIELEFLIQDLPKLFVSIEAGAHRIKNIIHSLRNFARLDEAEMKQVDIHEGIDNTLLVLQHRLNSASARPEIQVIKEYGKLPQIECYAGQLNQVFLNLLNNAIDAITEHQKVEPFDPDIVKPSILIRTAVLKSDWITVEVIDNGLGIPETVQQHLFEPFFTTKPVGKGTGLGLATSYQIVKKHGGKLTCHSVVGQGAKFVIEIPQKTMIAAII